MKNKPEDQWSCKRSPDIWASNIEAQNVQNLEKQGQEMTLTFNTHLLSFKALRSPQHTICLYASKQGIVLHMQKIKSSLVGEPR